MRVFGTTLFMLLGLVLAQTASAGEECCGSAECCGRCGCHANCEKYCKIVPKEKEIKKTVWGVKCEDFCAPVPRMCGGHGCGCASCGDCGDSCDRCGGKGCDVCSRIHTNPPHCGCVRTKKTLEKKEVTCKIQCWECVVVYACSGCGGACCEEGYAPEKAVDPTPAAPLPPGPKRSALPAPPIPK
jgi:hypothetical protein